MASRNEQETEEEDNNLRDGLITIGSFYLLCAGAVAVVGLPALVVLYGGLKLAEIAKDAVVDYVNADPPPPAPFRFDQRAADVKYAKRGNGGYGFVFEERMEEVRRKHGY